MNSFEPDNFEANKKVGEKRKATSHKSANDPTENEKGFSGGFVMEPTPGLYENVVVGDFNSLYPNIMITYGLDPSLLVLDEAFANCKGVKYLEIRFSPTIVFRYAWNQFGMFIAHTADLVASRKIAQVRRHDTVEYLLTNTKQGVQESYKDRMETCRQMLLSAFPKTTQQGWGDDEKKFGSLFAATSARLKAETGTQ